VQLTEVPTYMNLRYYMLNFLYVCVVVKQMVQDVCPLAELQGLGLG
jgi:hypothetical protein